MSNKTKIIILISILSIFLISMICIIVIKTKPTEEEVITTEGNYAVNPVKDREDIEDTEKSTAEENTHITIFANAEITNFDLLSPEQRADKENLNRMLTTCESDYTDEHGKVSSRTVLETSDNEQVYIETTFEDGFSETFVCGYNDTGYGKSHSFLRVVTLDYWMRIQSGENSG